MASISQLELNYYDVRDDAGEDDCICWRDECAWCESAGADEGCCNMCGINWAHAMAHVSKASARGGCTCKQCDWVYIMLENITDLIVYGELD